MIEFGNGGLKMNDNGQLVILDEVMYKDMLLSNNGKLPNHCVLSDELKEKLKL